MEDFIELGLEGADTMVDKHFHKIPDKALQGDTYNPKNLRKKHRHHHRQSSFASQESEDGPQAMSQYPRYSSDATPAPQYSSQYSQEPPSSRPQYEPYFPPPPPIESGRNRGRRYEDSDSDDGYYSDHRSRRPRAVSRRSSSYHGPRYSGDYDNERQLVQRNRRGSSHDISDQQKDGDHHNNFKEHFTKSPKGMTGAVGGALLGGYLAKKAQRRGGKESGNPLLTLLGAAAGGLAVNALVEKYEENKEKTAVRQDNYEDKWGTEEERDNGRGRRDNSRRRRSRSRSRSYSSER